MTAPKRYIGESDARCKCCDTWTEGNYCGFCLVECVPKMRSNNA